MPRYVAHFDETDHMDGRMLGIGGFFTTGGRLSGLAETWQEMRGDLEMEDREIRWNNLTWYKRDGLAAWVSVMPIWIVVDLLLDERWMSDRTARDHYRVGLRWTIARVARVAHQEPKIGQHQIIVYRVPSARRITAEDRGDERLQWAVGRFQTYAHAEYDRLYRQGDRKMGVPTLRKRGFYPSLLESEATFNCFLELADMAVGTLARWATAACEDDEDERLDQMVELMAPKLMMPNGEFGLDIFCPNWERNPERCIYSDHAADLGFAPSARHGQAPSAHI